MREFGRTKHQGLKEMTFSVLTVFFFNFWLFFVKQYDEYFLKHRTFKSLWPTDSLFRIYPKMHDVPSQGYTDCSTVCTNEKSETIQIGKVINWGASDNRVFCYQEEKKKNQCAMTWKGIWDIWLHHKTVRCLLPVWFQFILKKGVYE